MKKILLLSDTHGHLDAKVLKYVKEADEVWHAGDIGSPDVCEEIKKLKPVFAVCGNIDDKTMQAKYPEQQFFYCEEVKVMMIHIGGYPGKYPASVKKLIQEHRPNLFICGHSHILKVIYDKEHDMLCMNPGACGLQGFHQVKTLLRFNIEGKEIKNLEVIELGKRA